MAPVTVTMAVRGTASMAGMRLLITTGPPRPTAMATLPHITADTRRAMLPPTMVPGTAALFGPPARTAALVITIAGIAGDGQLASLKSEFERSP
jgi:hypothetical protein